MTGRRNIHALICGNFLPPCRSIDSPLYLNPKNRDAIHKLRSIVTVDKSVTMQPGCHNHFLTNQAHYTHTNGLLNEAYSSLDYPASNYRSRELDNAAEKPGVLSILMYWRGWKTPTFGLRNNPRRPKYEGELSTGQGHRGTAYQIRLSDTTNWSPHSSELNAGLCEPTESF
jgi:hypothetical protein